MATCPDCDAEIEVDADDLSEMEVGDPWDCVGCGSRLRVVHLDPLEFEADDEDDETGGDSAGDDEQDSDYDNGDYGDDADAGDWDD